jgi:hypothetical protein
MHKANMTHVINMAAQAAKEPLTCTTQNCLPHDWSHQPLLHFI